MRGRASVMTAVAAAGVLALTACSSGDDAETTSSASGDAAPAELTPVSVQLQWLTQAQFACYYSALDQGYYEDAGLDVTILPGAVDIVPIDVLTSGSADFAISWVPKVLGAIEQGAAVTNVAQIFERSGTLQVAFADSGIESAADLAGMKVGSWGYGNEWELIAGMQASGVTLEDLDGGSTVQQAFDMNAFIAGDIDAAQAMTYNEYAQVLEVVNPETGELYTEDDLVVIDWNDEGTAMLQDAIWADSERLASDEDYAASTTAFIKGTIEGCVFAKDDPQAAADIVTAAGSTLGTSHQLWMANEINKLIFPSTSGVGHINEDQWDATVAMALETVNPEGSTIITTEPPETAYSNEYVDAALAELEADGVDVMGADYAPIEVTLNEGGE
ncbi:ABC transporter substrate-binding protein [Demequina sp. SYSU T00039]|uniref:Thiamine pyrimidine synthase n=1 Tax=Demequina lignilytica TaxID=3051663 RepID=A0AAW7M405_9MICO|nr:MULTISPECIES: ABC transporter substrate-binding protein [unclassified Demequina]MDN4479181.1 ABC transporter substrate-binding protein [Demequina sp. SYSU T00039-1]MDN4487960.1 ABC transporter substrate-binding protein [Demequina sp. SYSU T00039]MDN4491766.1 ABC transporter substrate-binding protein [Demequina sp. SYSU T00068]